MTVDQKAPAKRRVRVSRRGDDVRERVLKAALECFGAFGFEGTSTRAVAEHADVTHTLVLYHFRSKEQLWIATIDNALGRYSAEMEEHLAGADDTAAGALRTFIEQFIRLSARQPQIHRILTMESNQDTTRLNWVIENYLRRHFAKVRELISRRAGAGAGAAVRSGAALLHDYRCRRHAVHRIDRIPRADRAGCVFGDRNPAQHRVPLRTGLHRRAVR
ncbi:TetR/AcrR family transcriptional regulator [Novosphingobium colocasiae]